MIWSKNVQPALYLKATRFSMLQKEFLPLVLDKCEITNGTQVLDVGCGTGCFAKFLSEGSFGVNYTGIEIDSNFAEKKEIMKGNNTFLWVCGNAYEMPFDNDTFDTIVSHTFFNCVEFPKRALSEMIRVAKKDAIVASVTSVANSNMLHNIGVYPEGLGWPKRLKELQRELMLALESIGIGPTSLNQGVCTEDMPIFFKENGLEEVSTLPLPYSFSLSDTRFTITEKKEYIWNIYQGEIERVEGAKELLGLKKNFSDLKLKEYEELLKVRYEFWMNHLDDNCVWDWFSGLSILVVGKKRGRS